jgi:dipeptidyl-peptidase 4
VESFPRLSARTRRFTLGHPRAFEVTPDGSRVLFLRSPSGTDPVHDLWVYDVAAGEERVLARSEDLLAGGTDELPPEERARRERARETAGGIVAYSVDGSGRRAALALGGRLFTVGVATGEVTELDSAPGVFDPRPSPEGELVAYSAGGDLRVTGPDGDRLLAHDDDPDVSWGVAEFVAAEEMGRSRGHWWAPDGRSVLAARVDERGVSRWHLADPTDPAAAVRTIRYPAAGTANAEVTLHIQSLAGASTRIRWDRELYPYLADVSWAASTPLTIVVQTRDQQRTQILTVDTDSGLTTPVAEAESPTWVPLVPGSPRWLDVGWLVAVAEDSVSSRLFVDGEPVSPSGVEVRRIVSVSGDTVLFTASEEPAEVHLWRWDVEGGARPVTSGASVNSASAGGDVVVISSSSLDHFGPQVTVRRGEEVVGRLRSHAETPPVQPQPRMLKLGERELRSALFLPNPGSASAEGLLPVILDPYGGPGAQRVLAARDAHLTSQWLADQGFAVLVVDGRGTPGRGVVWDRAIRHDFASAVLEDQIDGLLAAAEAEPRLDLTRVGIRGWSFGGYLAALAVLRRPDVFHAAVAGAPVTDWRLYDTHYTERYLGHPDDHPAAYEVSSLIADAPALQRPLLLIHGLADDNVVAAHSLQLSRALTEAGRAHSFLPLSGVSHMTPQEVVAENLMLLQVSFFSEMLAGPAAPLG